MPSPASPPPGRVLRQLKSGYWDSTELLEMPDGSRRVRKHNKSATTTAGPWGAESLRREIRFLQQLEPTAARHFPPVLAAWDSDGNIGYDMPFYAAHRDAGAHAANAADLLPQSEIDDFQSQLAQAVVGDLHKGSTSPAPLSEHFHQTVTEALAGLTTDPTLPPLLEASMIRLNGDDVAGPRAAWNTIRNHSDLLPQLDASPAVRLHGDFFLENLLWRRASTAAVPPDDTIPALRLIDPVSVAGISVGPALFDLVKYVSYATGELLALRSEWVHVTGFDDDALDFTYAVDWNAPGLSPFGDRNWYQVFRDAFIARHGVPDPALYPLIDGYFSMAMALNTRGQQRQARLLKATWEFHRALQAARA